MYFNNLQAQLLSIVKISVPENLEGKQAMLIASPVGFIKVIDKTSVIDNQVTFEIKIKEPSPAYIWIEGVQDDIHFFLDASLITLQLNPTLPNQSVIIGSPNTKLWKYQDSLLSLRNKLSWKIAQAKGDLRRTDSTNLLLSRKLTEVEDSIKKADIILIIRLIGDNPNSSASWYLFRNSFSCLPYKIAKKLFDKLKIFKKFQSYKDVRNELYMRNKQDQSCL